MKVPLIKHLIRWLYKFAEWGTKLNPLHNEFAIDIYEEGILQF